MKKEQILEMQARHKVWLDQINNPAALGDNPLEKHCILCGLQPTGLTEMVDDLSATALSALEKVEELEKELNSANIEIQELDKAIKSEGSLGYEQGKADGYREGYKEGLDDGTPRGPMY